MGVLAQTAIAQAPKVTSPDKNIEVELVAPKNQGAVWSFAVNYKNQVNILPEVKLGLLREDADFAHNLTLKGSGKIKAIHDQYTAIHGKKSLCINDGNEMSFHFINANATAIDVILRVYNNGIAFRYDFPEKKPGQFKMLDELTAFHVADSSKRWLQKFVRSYEGFYPIQENNFKTGEWGYPALFKAPGANECWALITEADIDRNYCTTKLTNTVAAKDEFKLTFPSPGDGNKTGDVNPTFSLPWQSPWRVAIIGQLADVVQSTLVEDVSKPPLATENFDWVKPGTSSWIYWADNHGTKDYQHVTKYVDLAARMGWPYTLFDWEWDQMSNGGDLEKAVGYALAHGVKPVIWYNSGGKHNTVMSTPRDRLSTHESRVKEFEWLNKIGIVGIKVDFFESDKQNIINYYIDILEDAAKYKLMVYFHGSTVPRGWSRTYPNLMTMEAVAGAEQYNNGPVMTTEAPAHNATLPFTRNVIGPMDYTPITFTNSQYTHTTTYAHELALAVVFESGVQNFADRPAGFDNLPYAEKLFLTKVPAAWDNTKLLSGYPGKSVVIARRKGKEWYIGGINGDRRGGQTSIDLGFLPAGKKYKLTLMSDGEYDSVFQEQYIVVENKDKVPVKWLPRGGFAAYLEEEL